MSVTMSVKDVDSSSFCPTAQSRNLHRAPDKYGMKSCSSYHLIRPVDDDVHTLWNTPKTLWITKKIGGIFGGQLRSTAGDPDCDFGQGVFVFFPVFARLSADTTPTKSARHDSLTMCGVVHISAFGSSWTCPDSVSAFSREVFWCFRRDVMTMTALLRIKDVQSRLSVPRSTVYELIDKGELERVYIASAPRIVDDSVEAYIDRLRVPGRITVRQGASR